MIDVKMIRNCTVYGSMCDLCTSLCEGDNRVVNARYCLQDDKIAPTGWLVE